MPSGYTQHIADGTETTLRQFALRCARGMGALISMRDEPSDAPIPTVLKAHTDYFDKMIAEGTAELARLTALTAQEVLAEFDAVNAEIVELRAKALDDSAAQRQRYQTLIEQTRQWRGAPKGIKDFMLGQLEDSMAFDTPTDPLKYHADVWPTSEAWFNAAMDKANRDIAHGTDKRADELRRTAERQAWLDQLFSALPPEEGN